MSWFSESAEKWTRKHRLFNSRCEIDPTFNLISQEFLREHVAISISDALKVPYLRQPLLLSFFTTQDRSNCLRQNTLQKILQATMLEPGKLLYPEDMQKIPEYVPAIAEDGETMLTHVIHIKIYGN